MSVKTNVKINGQNYYRITKTVGKKINGNAVESIAALFRPAS